MRAFQKHTEFPKLISPVKGDRASFLPLGTLESFPPISSPWSRRKDPSDFPQSTSYYNPLIFLFPNIPPSPLGLPKLRTVAHLFPFGSFIARKKLRFDHAPSDIPADMFLWCSHSFPFFFKCPGHLPSNRPPPMTHPLLTPPLGAKTCLFFFFFFFLSIQKATQSFPLRNKVRSLIPGGFATCSLSPIFSRCLLGLDWRMAPRPGAVPFP